MKITQSEINMVWLIENRAKVAEALNVLDALKSARVIIGGSGSMAGTVWNGSSLTIMVPAIRGETYPAQSWSKLSSVADSIANASDVSTKLNQLLAALRAAGMM